MHLPPSEIDYKLGAVQVQMNTDGKVKERGRELDTGYPPTHAEV